ncbi:MAG TPA: Nramp family divalent metal transporter [Gammaproteobacteria bacterium]|nr:Nramp family divalent metal transporter [Gammaproteobacteria bacterium]
MLRSLRQIGPGALVTAAFIGPGTVTACTLAGAQYGHTLLWALAFATIATTVFQEMAGRLGAVAQRGLGEALRTSLRGSVWRWPLYALVVLALYAGNAAYEAGNLSGAALGIEALAGTEAAFRGAVLTIVAVAAAMLWHGSYRHIERFMIGLVVVMGAAFVGTFVVSGADLAAFARGLLVPTVPAGSLVTVLALIGTTVVPYNLFLHATAARTRWSGPADLPAMRADSVLSIGLGGIVSMLIVSTAAASLFARGLAAGNAAEMAVQLEPLFGRTSRYLLGAGLLAAGLSSSITAPLATAYAVTEVLGPSRPGSRRVFRAVSLSVLAIGCVFALSGIRPVTIILSAQFANGLLLPIIAAYLLWAMNDRRLLGTYVNGTLANVLGGLVLLVSVGLGARLILTTLGGL